MAHRSLRQFLPLMPIPERLTIGHSVGVFGTHGELKISIETDFPERFKQLKRVFICDKEFEAEACRLHRAMALLKLRGVDDANGADALVDCDVAVAIEDSVKLEPGRYYIYQIEGLRVETREGEYLGTVAEILQTGANDVYIVKDADRPEILLPAIASVIKQIDIEHGRMVVELMDGLR